jgi:hypothetical protein
VRQALSVLRPTPGQVLTLAPDNASRRAAAALANPGPWDDAGCDARAVWGHCRGSARQPYAVSADVREFAHRCTCPSQKQPCKHVLALLLLWAEGSPVVAAGAAPAEVAAWLATRSGPADGTTLADRLTEVDPGPEGDRTDGPAQLQAAAPAPERPSTDPAAAAARIAQRAGRIAGGMAELDRWLADLLRAGLAAAATQPYSFWDGMAARLVDAQAPGAAASVRDLAGMPHTGEGWPGRLLAAVARLHLVASGWARYERLPENTRADLRTAAGWPWPAETVLAAAREADRWYVLARVATDDPQLRVQRTWLWGLTTGRPALIVDFARPGAPFAWQLWPGQVMDAQVARYPGSEPLRVLVAERSGDPVAGGRPPGWPGLTEMAEARGRALASDPWSERWPVSVRHVVPDRVGSGWAIRDRENRTIELSSGEEAGWKLAAVSGGRPVQLLGEWAGQAVTPLGVWAEDRMVVL